MMIKNKDYLKFELETNIPILTSDKDRILRCSQIVAHWKRNIYRMLFNVYLLNHEIIDVKTFQQVFDLIDNNICGRYSISVNVNKCEQLEIKTKKTLDYRLKANLFYYDFTLYLFLFDIHNKIKEELKELYIYSFIYTLLISGLGQISSKGLGHLLIKDYDIPDLNVKINYENLPSTITQLFEKCCDLIIKILNKYQKYENLKIPKIYVSSFKKEKNKYEPEAKYIRSNYNIEIVYNGNNLDQEYLDFIKNYIASTMASKLKLVWKKLRGYYPETHGGTLHTWILGLPRSSKKGGYKIVLYNKKTCNIKMLSQIKYIPYGKNKIDFDLILLFYPHSIRLINTIYKSGYLKLYYNVHKNVSLNKIRTVEGIYEPTKYIDLVNNKLFFECAKDFIFSVFKSYFE